MTNPVAGHLFENAIMALRANRRQEASDLLWEVIRNNPTDAAAWSIRARIEADEQRYANAVLHHSMAIQLAPDSAEIWCNRAIDCMGAKMYREATEGFERSLALKDTFEGHYNFGNLLCANGHVEAGIAHYRIAQGYDDKHYQLRSNLGAALIGLGHWKEGWAHYRHRFLSPGFPPRPRLSYRQWEGEPLEGKTILGYVEQGFGDEIQSYRFIQYLKRAGARTILCARPPCFRLARTALGADAVILQYDQPPWEPDYQVALLDVPYWLGLEPKDISGQPYLSAEDRGFSLKFPAPFKVGLCWASGKRNLQPSIWMVAQQKSLELKQLAPLAREGVSLMSLQQQHEDADLIKTLGIHDPMLGVTDFMDTAWLISQLDLVVTVDTAVAHLAGALGKPVWNLVRFDALWPWMQETRETCWYDSMRIYRQPKPFNWREPLKRMMAEFGGLDQRSAAA